MAGNVGPIRHTRITRNNTDRLDRQMRRPGGGSSLGVAAADTPDNIGPLAIAANGSVTTGWSIDESLGTGGLTVISGDLYYEPGVYVATLFVRFSGSAGTAQNYAVEFGDLMTGSTLVTWRGDLRQISTTGNFHTATQQQAGVYCKYVSGPAASTLTMLDAYLQVTRLGDVPA